MKLIKKIEDIGENQDIVYLFENKKVTPRVITKGLSDMTNIEIKEGLSLDDNVIIEAIEPRKR